MIATIHLKHHLFLKDYIEIQNISKNVKLLKFFKVFLKNEEEKPIEYSNNIKILHMRKTCRSDLESDTLSKSS